MALPFSQIGCEEHNCKKVSQVEHLVFGDDMGPLPKGSSPLQSSAPYSAFSPASPAGMGETCELRWRRCSITHAIWPFVGGWTCLSGGIHDASLVVGMLADIYGCCAMDRSSYSHRKAQSYWTVSFKLELVFCLEGGKEFGCNLLPYILCRSTSLFWYGGTVVGVKKLSPLVLRFLSRAGHYQWWGGSLSSRNEL